ncbi:MAG TPA: sigma-70 family RNA polymerase sigma factor [Chloroflexia bacterium]|nr:sigma-70 family RNA polymerase sigma factor [Chloroflexia bacterium]
MNQRASRPSLVEDATLVTRLQRGDPRAVEYVVQHHAPELYRYIYYQVRDAMTAEDLVADVLVRMVEKVDKYVFDSTPFRAWLFRIARNLVADHYRARKRRPQVSYETWMTTDPRNEPGHVDDGIEVLGDRQELQVLLARLTDEQREVILLHVVEGWELPQVARLLERTLPAVKSAYYRGVQSLRRGITRDGSTGGRVSA